MKCIFLVLVLLAVAHSIPLDAFDDEDRKVDRGSSMMLGNNNFEDLQKNHKLYIGKNPYKKPASNEKATKKPTKIPTKKPLVGGSTSDVTTAFVNQFPELVYIKVSDSVPCQGSLITPDAILTSASCFWNIAGGNNSITEDPTMIQIGKPETLEITIDPTMEVKNVTICPYYSYLPLSKVHENNLAIVLLKKPVAVWKNITVAGSSTGKPDGHSKVQGALVAGWGMTTNPSNVSDPSSTTMLKFAKVLVASQKACAAQYGALNASSVYLLGKTMLCSNVTATKTSSCQGDEGASLRYLDTKTQVPVLFAIISPPIETDCPTTLHSLYTNVGAHTKWINSVTGLKIK